MPILIPLLQVRLQRLYLPRLLVDAVEDLCAVPEPLLLQAVVLRK